MKAFMVVIWQMDDEWDANGRMVCLQHVFSWDKYASLNDMVIIQSLYKT